MIKKITTITAVLFFLISFSQEKAFKDGEWLKYALSYSGFLKAGEAEIQLSKEYLNGKKVLHAKGKGRTLGMVHRLFKVNDRYESYFDFDKIKPYKFVRDVSEGSYKVRRDIEFKNNKAYIKDYELNKKDVKGAVNVQDMISCFYYIRAYDTSKMKIGDELKINMFLDGEIYPFKLKYLGNEVLKSKFGKLKTQIFRPMVEAGRVFKSKESVTVWVTADKNKLPILIKAQLRVGSAIAKLKEYKGVSHILKKVIVQ